MRYLIGCRTVGPLIEIAASMNRLNHQRPVTIQLATPTKRIFPMPHRLVTNPMRVGQNKNLAMMLMPASPNFWETATDVQDRWSASKAPTAIDELTRPTKVMLCLRP